MKISKKKVIVTLVLSFIFMFTITIPVSAGLWDSLWEDLGGEETVNFLTQYEDYLAYGTFLTGILYWVGWGFIKGLYFLVDLVEGLIPQSLDLLDFLESTGLSSVTSAVINDLVVALMVLILVFLGFKTIVAKEPPNFKNVGVNIFISAFLILGLPTLMNTMEDISVKFYNATQTGNNNGEISSLSWGLIQDNTTDLLYVGSIGFPSLDDPTTAKNNLTPETFKIANLDALITPDTVDDSEGEGIEHLTYRLDTNENGEVVADKIKGGAFSWFTDSFEEGYMRYHVNFVPVIVGLMALGVAYIFTIFVFISTIIEIGFKQVVGLFVFATDLESGQRTKMVVKDIMNAFLLIAFTGLSLQLYTMFLSFLSTSNANFFIYIVAIVSATFILIKGSSTIMRYFGVDVGVKDGFAQLAGAFAVGRATAGGAKKLNDLAKGKRKSSFSNGNDSRDQLQQQNGNEQHSINDSASGSKGMLKSMGDKFKSSLGNGFKENLQNSINTAKGKTDNLAMAGVAGVTSGAMQQIGKESEGISDQMENSNNKASINDQDANNKWNNLQSSNAEQMENNSLKESVQQEPNSTNPSEKMKRIEDSSEGTGITSRSNEEILARMKLDDNTQLENTDANGNLNMATKLNRAPDMEDNQAKMNGKGQSNEEILTNMKLNDAMQLKNTDAEGNLNMKTQADKPAMNDQGTMQQNVSADMKVHRTPLNEKGEVTVDMKTNGVPFNQKAQVTTDMKVNSPKNVIQKGILETAATSEQQITQRVLQQVEQTSFSDPESAKQNIIQSIQQSSLGSSDVKQKVIQEIERSNIATPEQVQQNVQQVLSNARLPQDMQSSVQRVIQEVQHSASSSPETIKNKVIEEIEQADFGSKEPLRQMVMQQVERSFSATPEQMEQNIKQTISASRSEAPQTNETNTTQVVQEKVVTKSQSKNQEGKYFGTLLGNHFKSEPVSSKKSSRFDKYKQK
ncbi:pLS20_p028 family conjugation system transmembrane protein [Oceanobacillus caeni]|nr:hypothetical protein [Virgibacillus sp. SK37]HAJ4038285.1 hypothetical protein [Escherichia coli]